MGLFALGFILGGLFGGGIMALMNARKDDELSVEEEPPTVENIKRCYIIKELDKFDFQTLVTAYAYAKNLHFYGIDVTEKWETVAQQSVAMDRAYRKAYYDAMNDVYKRDHEEG